MVFSAARRKDPRHIRVAASCVQNAAPSIDVTCCHHKVVSTAHNVKGRFIAFAKNFSTLARRNNIGQAQSIRSGLVQSLPAHRYE